MQPEAPKWDVSLILVNPTPVDNQTTKQHDIAKDIRAQRNPPPHHSFPGQADKQIPNPESLKNASDQPR